MSDNDHRDRYDDAYQVTMATQKSRICQLERDKQAVLEALDRATTSNVEMTAEAARLRAALTELVKRATDPPWTSSNTGWIKGIQMARAALKKEA